MPNIIVRRAQQSLLIKLPADLFTEAHRSRYCVRSGLMLASV